MAINISHSPAETEALGVAWAAEARPGWLLGLAGDLGAGKTQLVRGLARGLGCPDRVHSPSFALLVEYHGGRLPLYHLDLYRLKDSPAIVSAGLEEYLLEPQGVVVVEWVDRWLPEAMADWVASIQRQPAASGWAPPPDLPRPSRLVWMECGEGDKRAVYYEDFGA